MLTYSKVREKAGAANCSRRTRNLRCSSLHIPWRPASIGVAIAGLGWLIRTLGREISGLRRSKFDLIIALVIALDGRFRFTLRRTSNQHCEASGVVVSFFFFT